MVRETDLIKSDIHAYLERYQKKELLRFVTIGSVDDGKSTLIGRLLNDTNSVYIDQLEGAKKKTKNGEEEIDLALITDGLKAEREQGITIDVAYRYFSTEKRKFIIADTPGHEQYTRNMATGASTAQVALILIDARLGILAQSKRHAYIASLLGIPNLLVCVNKMDLKNYSKEIFDSIKSDFSDFLSPLGFQSVTFVPVSALKGDNVVSFSSETSWYDGPTVLSFLENVPIHRITSRDAFAFPVQYVLRPNLNYRGYAGVVISGVAKIGDDITVLPSGKKSKIKSIDTYDGSLESVFSPQSVVITLNDEIDISRGDMIVHQNHSLKITKEITAMMVWMDEKPLYKNRQYYLKHTSNMVTGLVSQVDHVIDVHSLEKKPQTDLNLNDIGQVKLRLARPIIADDYKKNRRAGSFILIDRLTNKTVACGMISDFKGLDDHESLVKKLVSSQERASVFLQKAAMILVENDKPDKIQDLLIAIERKLFSLSYQAISFTSDRIHRIFDGHTDLETTARYLDLCLELGQIVIFPISKNQNLKSFSNLQNYPSIKVVAGKDDINTMVDQIIDQLTKEQILF